MLCDTVNSLETKKKVVSNDKNATSGSRTRTFGMESRNPSRQTKDANNTSCDDLGTTDIYEGQTSTCGWHTPA